MSYPVQWGYGEGHIEINDSPNPQRAIEGKPLLQQISIPLQTFDDMVLDYIKNRREAFLASGKVQGAVFDDDLDSGF